MPETLKDLLERAGVSQRELSRGVDIDKSSMCRLMAGKRELAADEARDIARFMNLNADLVVQAYEETRRQAGTARRPLAEGEAGEPGDGPALALDMPFPDGEVISVRSNRPLSPLTVRRLRAIAETIATADGWQP